MGLSFAKLPQEWKQPFAVSMLMFVEQHLYQRPVWILWWSLGGYLGSSLVACCKTEGRTASMRVEEGAGGGASPQPPLGKAYTPVRVTKVSFSLGGSLLRFLPLPLLCWIHEKLCIFPGCVCMQCAESLCGEARWAGRQRLSQHRGFVSAAALSPAQGVSGKGRFACRSGRFPGLCSCGARPHQEEDAPGAVLPLWAGKPLLLTAPPEKDECFLAWGISHLLPNSNFTLSTELKACWSTGCVSQGEGLQHVPCTHSNQSTLCPKCCVARVACPKAQQPCSSEARPLMGTHLPC